MKILIQLLFYQVCSFLYTFNASNQYLLIEVESQTWEEMQIQIYENEIKQSEAYQNYEQYLQLYYKLKVGSQYELDIIIKPNTNFNIIQVDYKECPKQCSNQGQCVDKKCLCNQLYFGSRCQFIIQSYYNIQQYNVELSQFQTDYFQLSYIESDLVNDQGQLYSLTQRQTKQLMISTNIPIFIQLYIILPYQTLETSLQNTNMLWNQTLNDTTIVDYSNFYQSYPGTAINYSFFFIFINQDSGIHQFQLTFYLQSLEITFQDFILVTILSVVAFIILLIVIFIVRRRCQFIQISRLKYQIDQQPKIDLASQLQVVAPAKDEECIVCLDPLESQQCRQTPCRHVFHSLCLNEWLQKQQTCPLCRENLFEEDGQQVIKIRNLSSSSIVAGQFSIMSSERQPIQQIILARPSNRLAAFQ